MSSSGKSKPITFYNLPNDCCSCRDENFDTTKIGRNFRKFYEELVSGKRAVDILDDMGVMRSCCRIKYLCLTTDIMKDRTKERFQDYTVFPNINLNTRELEPLISPPDFPIL